MNNTFLPAAFLIFFLSIFINITFFTDYEIEVQLKEKFLANDSLQVVFAVLPSFVVAEYEGQVHYTTTSYDYFKLKNAIQNNDTIYIYDKYKGVIPFVNWPLIKIGGRLSAVEMK